MLRCHRNRRHPGLQLSSVVDVAGGGAGRHGRRGRQRRGRHETVGVDGDAVAFASGVGLSLGLDDCPLERPGWGLGIGLGSMV